MQIIVHNSKSILHRTASIGKSVLGTIKQSPCEEKKVLRFHLQERYLSTSNDKTLKKVSSYDFTLDRHNRTHIVSLYKSDPGLSRDIRLITCVIFT